MGEFAQQCLDKTMEGKSFLLLLCVLVFQESECFNDKRLGKISLFNIVEFPNDNCEGANGFNGTCYTKQECTTRDGTVAGECAQGYGVCCVISLACGESAAENITYLQMAATTSPPNPGCEYKICPSNINVCRIRFDFELFNIAGPSIETDRVTDGLNGGALGDCVTDTFVVRGSQYSSPQICGTNAGQHIFADATSECVTPAFRFGNTNAQREYRIKITQYVCGDEMGGPIGCLQYFTGVTGRVASFNFPLTATTIPENTEITHLSDQHYDICFRRAAGNCRLCFSPSIEDNANSALPASFGLGITPDAGNNGKTGNECTEDYLIIPQMGSTAANAQANTDKICGRRFNTANDMTIATICTARVPFTLRFRSDQDEDAKLNKAALNNDESINDAVGNVPGYLGFSLNFLQEAC